MPVKQKKQRPSAPAVAAIVAHPLRARCWVVLSERVASPNELKNMFGAAIGDVSYHVGVLEKLGHVELVDTKPRRGAIEHYYRAVERPTVDDAELAAMTPDQRAELAERTVQLAFADAAVAFDRKTFSRRAETRVERRPWTVDEQGFSELNDAYADLLERSTQIAAASADRLDDDPAAEPIPVSAVAMVFEMPEHAPSPSDPERRTNQPASS
jgi:hypothetical protein